MHPGQLDRQPRGDLGATPDAREVGSGRSLVRNSALSLVTTALDALGAFVVSVLIARLLGARSTGVFGYAQTLASTLLAVLGLGIPALLAQRIAEAAPSGRSWVPILRSGLSVFVAVSTPAAIVTFLAIWSVTGDRLGDPLTVFAALVSAFGLAVSATTLGCDRSRGDFVTPLLASVVTKTALITAIVAVALLGLGIEGYMVAAAGVQAAVAAVLLRRLSHVVRGAVLRRPLRADVETVRDALPFAILVFLELVSFRADTLLVEWIRGGVETGWYVAAYTVYTLPTLFSWAVASAYYPWITRARASKVGVSKASTLTLGVVTLYGLAAALLFVLLAPLLVRIAFGDAFEPAVTPLRILALSIPFVAANRMGLMELKGAGRIRAAAVACFAATLVSIAGNLLVLPRFGLAGAAWVNLVTEVVTLAAVAFLGAWRQR
jgi:O-antigen/teichoic acid export membrane protein